MVTVSWTSYLLNALFLLTFSSWAFPTDHSPTEASSNDRSLVVRDGVQTYCQARAWAASDSVLLYPQSPSGTDVEEQPQVVIIMLQTSAGGILCVIGPDDFGKMWSDGHFRPPSFQSLFSQGMRGPHGHLTLALNQLKEMQTSADADNCGAMGPFQIFAAQIAAPSREETVLNREELLTRIANSLLVAAANSGNPDLAVPIYSFQYTLAHLMQRWKAAMNQVATTSVWIGFRGLWPSQPRGDVGHIEMRGGESYEDDRGLQRVVFRSGTPYYSGMAAKLVQYDTKELDALTWGDLDLWGSRYTPNGKTLELSAAHQSRCEYVPWSRAGALLGFMNNNGDSTWIALTSIGAVMCYFPVLNPRNYNTANLRAYILDPLASAFKALDDLRDSNTEAMTIYENEIWFHTNVKGPKLSKTVEHFISSLRTELPVRLQAEGVQVAKSNIPLTESHADKTLMQKRFAPNSETAWMAIYQQPTTGDTKPQVLLMKMFGKKTTVPEDLITFDYVAGG
ncbi:uncharacterized protein N7459_003803 [Penicillium hispanicum]|uniref:uncharacterized protein n=1 Tax=Penicillium hispanicum TaxID=1080232 RepID=UPI002540949E|nr:uncharacterized protein N7459_003803 [Penicillium hispanicum]KAJ5584003.1 hypothetical protein N7459_003803 [Penicillium hispanicum]